MEVLDVYDVHGNKLNKTTVRGNLELVEGEEFIKIVTVWFRSGIRYLIQLVSEEKGSVYAVTGGHVPTGSTSREQAKVECKEELGFDLEDSKLTYIGPVVEKRVIIDVYLYEDEDIDLEAVEFELQEEEVESVCWLTKDEMEDMILKGTLRDSTAHQYMVYIKNM
jgi:ADP-ribose pyrophosphatase YjhB (NUDIX family)